MGSVSASCLINLRTCTGSRQASKLRQRYLQAVLRQEPAYFDVHTTPGELLQGLNDDTSAIQLAIGEKACTCAAAHSGVCEFLLLHNQLALHIDPKALSAPLCGIVNLRLHVVLHAGGQLRGQDGNLLCRHGHR